MTGFAWAPELSAVMPPTKCHAKTMRSLQRRHRRRDDRVAAMCCGDVEAVAPGSPGESSTISGRAAISPPANRWCCIPLVCDLLAKPSGTSNMRWISTGLSRPGEPAPLPWRRLRMRLSRRCWRWGALTVPLAAYDLAAPLWQNGPRAAVDRRLRGGTRGPPA